MPKQKITYDAAMAELEQIVADMNRSNEPIEMETYLAKARRAKELIRFCRQQLTKFDAEIKEILDETAETTEP